MRRLICLVQGHDTTHVIESDDNPEFTQGLLAEPPRGKIVECRRCKRMVIKQDYAQWQD